MTKNFVYKEARAGTPCTPTITYTNYFGFEASCRILHLLPPPSEQAVPLFQDASWARRFCGIVFVADGPNQGLYVLH